MTRTAIVPWNSFGSTWLRAGWIAGEFDERMSRALQAKTSSEITPLFADLPEPRPSTALEPA